MVRSCRINGSFQKPRHYCGAFCDAAAKMILECFLCCSIWVSCLRLRANAGKLCRTTVGRTMLNALPSVSATLTQLVLQATLQGRWKKMAGQQKPDKCVVVASLVFAVGVLLATWLRHLRQLFVPIAVFLNLPTRLIISRSVPGAGLHATVAMNVRKRIGNRSTSTSASVPVTDVAPDACQELKKSQVARCSSFMLLVFPTATTCIYCPHTPFLAFASPSDVHAHSSSLSFK